MERYHEKIMLGRCDVRLNCGWNWPRDMYCKIVGFHIGNAELSHRSVLIFSISCPFQDVIFTSK
jgi:hypothetical protein